MKALISQHSIGEPSGLRIRRFDTAGDPHEYVTEFKGRPTVEARPRCLSAVMFTDVVGYTTLMHKDEEAARVVRLRHREVLEAAIATEGGELVQYLGDGSLSTFPSVVRAVSAAVEVQQELREEVPLRIGVHQGEIAFDEQGIYGDSVNVAARVMGLATAGSVLLSEKVYDELKNQRNFSTVSLGQFSLKNVTSPLLVHAASGEGLNVPTRGDLLALTGPGLARPSWALAVSWVALLAAVIGTLLV
jgi:class 3 adenylate cyclase